MTDPVVESTATPEVQAKAEALGWIPPSRFKGDPERFVDAEAYVERGETILPIVKEHNKRLERQVADLAAANAAQAATLKAATTSLAQIEERNTVAMQKAIEQTRREVKAQLAAASEAGDHAGVAELTDQLTTLNAAPEPAKPAIPPAPVAAPVDPEVAAWNAENTWFGTDKRKTALALGIAQELREGGESSTGRRFMDKVAEELDAMLAPKGETKEPVSKVEGARNGNGGGDGGSRTGGKGYASMPADARAACDADIRKFVGPGKSYKTPEAWRARYAEIYFE